MAIANSERLVTVNLALGRPVSQKPDTVVHATSGVLQPTPDRLGLGCIRTDYCEAFFTLESDSVGYNIALDSIRGTNSAFEMVVSQALPTPASRAGNQPPPRVINFHATITTDLSQPNADEDTMLTVGIMLGRPVSQKPDSVIRSATSSVAEVAAPRTAWACSDMERCEAVFNLDSVTAGYSITLSPITRPGCTFEITASQPASTASNQTERVITLEIKMITT